MYWHTDLRKMMKVKLAIGDVFNFENSQGEYGHGQIIYSDIIQYIVIFERKLKKIASLTEAVISQPLLAGWTSDARFYVRKWKVIGNHPSIPSIKLPEYKIEIDRKIWVTDVHGKLLRLASTEEEQSLGFQKSYSPITFEKAFWAYHGGLPWEHRFEELRVA